MDNSHVIIRPDAAIDTPHNNNSVHRPLNEELTLAEKTYKIKVLQSNIRLLRLFKNSIAHETLRHHYNFKQIPAMLMLQAGFSCVLFLVYLFSMYELSALILSILHIPMLVLEMAVFGFYTIRGKVLTHSLVKYFSALCLVQFSYLFLLVLIATWTISHDRAFHLHWFDKAVILLQLFDCIFPLLFIYAADQIAYSRGRISVMTHKLHSDGHIVNPHASTVREIEKYRARPRSGYLW